MRPARLLCLLAAVVPGCGLLARESCTRDDTDRPGLPEVKGGRVFANIFLVIHCRWEAEADPDVVRGICEERRPLFRGFRKVFADVLYMTSDDCPNAQGRADPGACLADLVEGRAANRDGLFYMHFDALIRPRSLGATFDKHAIGRFDTTETCYVELAEGQQQCVDWPASRAKPMQAAIMAARELGKEFRKLDNMTYVVGNDDLFYIPRSVFRPYGLLARLFQHRNVTHELAGPTVRHLLHQMTAVPSVNMNCTGDCCRFFAPDVALSPDFRCGHKFDLSDADMRATVASTIIEMERKAVYRANSSRLAVWQQLVDQALA
uniref:Protein xylosyltransferase n=1 Tax=Alexandrium catenella TaxID=2925 RepID=A0A7S1SH46_ALECA|mmetsp:Transcript_98331/g.261254  ORF Transcript_98331/g.261254 Transcript_98331/m.261254 type:complete len:320 (+) Transcript_98331:83-1042(+)